MLKLQCKKSTEQSKKPCSIYARFRSQSLPLPRDISAKCGGRRHEKRFKINCYENRTKSAKCGGLETNGPRERISGPHGLTTVRRFRAKGRGYWRFHRAKNQRRMLVAEGPAEGEELSSNGLLSWSVQKCTCGCDPDSTRALRRQEHSAQRQL